VLDCEEWHEKYEPRPVLAGQDASLSWIGRFFLSPANSKKTVTKVDVIKAKCLSSEECCVIATGCNIMYFFFESERYNSAYMAYLREKLILTLNILHIRESHIIVHKRHDFSPFLAIQKNSRLQTTGAALWRPPDGIFLWLP
jgi:hypothetical protein